MRGPRAKSREPGTARGEHTMVNTRGFNPQTGEWNDTLIGVFLWSC